MSWVKLDDRFTENPKIAALSDAAFVAYVSSICYCARELTDGFVPLKKAREYAKARTFNELTPALWEPCSGGVRIHDYLKYNPTREQALAVKGERSKAGSKGAANRWQSDKQTDSKADTPLPVSPSLSPNPLTPAPSPIQLLEQRPNIFVLYEQLFGRGVYPLIAELPGIRTPPSMKSGSRATSLAAGR